ncbi:MAG: trigger factor [Sporomusaceae bacterium]|nr:trigger factor [Sporomusaceae bacterium]
MRVTAEKIDNHQIVLEVEIPQPEVDKAFDRAYQRLAGKVNIPGFRKGKAPRKILEARLGKEALAEETFELLAPQAYSKALDEQNIEPVSRPQIDVVQLEAGKPFVFKATVVAKPAVTLGEYKGLKAAKPPVAVSEEEIGQKLDDMRQQQAKMVVVPEAVLQNGDFAIIDFEGFVDGQPFKGGDAKGYPLEVGSGSFIPGFEEQLLGAKAGETREVSVSFPADYFVAELAGKEAKFNVVIQDVKRKELPEVDDDFVKEASSFNTVEELKADIKNKLEVAAEQKHERDFRNAIMEQAVKGVQADVPAVMIESKIDQMIEDLDLNLQNRGLKLENYLQYMGTDAAGLREKYRESADTAVRTDLLLDEIAKAEDLKVENEDLDKEVQAMAQTYNAPVEEVRKVIIEQGRVGMLAQSVLRKKAMQVIFDTAAVTEAAE